MDTMQSEDDLVQRIKIEFYQVFQSRDLQPKKAREKAAWNLLRTNRGNYTQQLLNQIFDTVDRDPYAPNQRWFGQLLAKPNRNLIFCSTSASISGWIEHLLFSNDALEKRLAVAEESRPKGSSKGVATCFYICKTQKSTTFGSPPHIEALNYSVEFKDWKNQTGAGIIRSSMQRQFRSGTDTSLSRKKWIGLCG